MKRWCALVWVLLFCATTYSLAAVDRRTSAGRTRQLPATLRSFPDLRQAGPVWRNSQAPRATNKIRDRLCQVKHPADGLLSSLSAKGLEVHSLTMAENGTATFLTGRLGSAKQLQRVAVPAVHTAGALADDRGQQDAILAISWLQTFASSLSVIDPSQEFIATHWQLDDLGKRHVRLQQRYRGVPVWANDLYVHIDADDQVYAVNGRYAPTPTKVTSLEAAISANNALAIANVFLKQKNVLKTIDPGLRKAMNLPDACAEKAIYLDRQGQGHLVWQVDLYANLRDWYTLFVDAQTGDILHQLCNTAYEGPVNASGLDLSGVNRSFRAYEEQGVYYMLSDVNELGGGATALPNNPTGGLWVIDLRNSDPTETANFYFIQSSSAGNWTDRSAVSAMYNLVQTYDYFKNVHNRRAIDNSASTIISVVNVTEDGQAMDNAYWNGRAIFWGNGQSYFKPLAGSLDVTAHELTHGITQYTANLIYQDQSGAMNEAMSDFFGVMVDRGDWLMGEDIMRPGTGNGLRDVSQPNNPNVMSPLPVKMSQYLYTYEDQGGVHSNCGILNRAGYLVANQIGRDKAEKIWYRALTTYLTRQSQFIDGRKALEQSAQDLYSTAEVAAIKKAFDEVEITDSGTVTPGDDTVNPTTGGSPYIAFIRDDLQIGLYDFSTKRDYVFPNIKALSTSNNYTQLSATADGRFLYFVNENGYIARLDLSAISTGSFDYEALNNIMIQQPGDIWNVAVTRDNQILAFTSQYEDDNSIYFYIDRQIYRATLDLPTTQTGITGSTIRFPDVISWSPNMKYPKLAFDAYNEIELAGGNQRSWWSMGEIDLSGESLKLYSLLPAQPEGVDVGNVQYSSINPQKIIYNYIEANGTWLVKIQNFAEAGAEQVFRLAGIKLQRPSFSPDDQKFVIDPDVDNKLLICDVATETGEVITLQNSAKAYNPKWLVIGGTFDTQVTAESAAHAPSGFCLAANYPNPFNSSTRISYRVERQEPVRLQVFDLTGRWVRTLVDGEFSAGEHVVIWDGRDDRLRAVPSGVYFCRMSSANRLLGELKMLLLR